MDDFSDSFATQPPSTPPPEDSEADPAAEFLAKEQEELAGLEDEIGIQQQSLTIVTNGLSPTASAGNCLFKFN